MLVTLFTRRRTPLPVAGAHRACVVLGALIVDIGTATYRSVATGDVVANILRPSIRDSREQAGLIITGGRGHRVMG